MSRYEGFYAPWEHPVCPRCLQSDGHRLHLALAQCFNPKRHSREVRVAAVVDNDVVRLRQVKPLPQHAMSFRGNFHMCRKYDNCRRRDCSFAHSSFEVTAWSTKKLALGKRDLDMMCSVKSTSYPLVCETCLELYHNPVWLMWLKCIEPDRHRDSARVRVALSEHQDAVVRVNEPVGPPLHKCCQDTCDCEYYHSFEDKEYWKFLLVKSKCEKKYSNYRQTFQEFCDEYSYPEDITSSPLMKVVKNKVLTHDTYAPSFRLLLHLDELEKSRKLIAECDMPNAEFSMTGNVGYISNVHDAVFGYIANATVFISHPDIGIHECPDHSVSQLHINDTKLKVTLLPSKFRDKSHVHLHFERSSLPLARMETALNNLKPHHLEKLIQSNLPSRQRRIWIHKGVMDAEYQMKALKKAINCDPKYPFLILGPFGTGKTRLLVTAADNLMQYSPNVVLVCTHMNRGADYFCEHYCNEFNTCQPARVAPTEKKLNEIIVPENTRKLTPRQLLKNENLNRLIVTTFMTAPHLKKLQEKYSYPRFTHILIDEGAQSTEPEVLCALTLANSKTKIIIAGDNYQVGPQTSVLSAAALKYGLGKPILERLYENYKDIGLESRHTATLLTNYRCHPTILMLSSSLFYENTLLSRSKSKPHPLAPYPLVFACTSLSTNSLEKIPTTSQEEADLLIDKVIQLYPHWEKEIRDSGCVKTIGVLASSKDQTTLLRKTMRRKMSSLYYSGLVSIMPTYNIQGEEFVAVFLSTNEPTNSRGELFDLNRSVCNEFVFNTVVTRAMSLVYCVGNPLKLIELGKKCKINCWAEFLQRCIATKSLVIPTHEVDLPAKIERLWSEVDYEKKFCVLPSSNQEEMDSILARYLEDLHKRDEYKKSFSLVQQPKVGKTMWVQDDNDPTNVVFGTLELENYRKGKAILENGKEVEIEGHRNRVGAMHGDKTMIKVNPYTNKGQVVFDSETAQAITEKHFGQCFLCRVDEYSSTLFYPLDNRCPKFVNLPTITRNDNEGVVCFDPSSINTTPKVSDFIPFEVAKSMVFIMYYLRWDTRRTYPLGIIVGAFPEANSLFSGLTLLKIKHNVLTSILNEHPKCERALQISKSLCSDAFTIDPEHSQDLDDAFTCTPLPSSSAELKYKIGIHITDVASLVPKDSSIDKFACAQGCSLYLNTRSVSNMLPLEVVQLASFTSGNVVQAFSIFTTVTIKDGHVISSSNPEVCPTSVKSTQTLSYGQVQLFLQENTPLDSSTIKSKIHILWKFAQILRTKRLKGRAFVIQNKEADGQELMEAHLLVEELMIYANQQIAKKLLKHHDLAIIRTQEPPEESDLSSLRNNHSQTLACFNSTKHLATDECNSEVIVSLKVLQKMKAFFKNNELAEALHCLANELNHPQFLAIYKQVIGIKKGGKYKVLELNDETDCSKRSHYDLACDCYTHFTSPIRRYVDIVVQRLLTAYLYGNPLPYAKIELDSVCKVANEAFNKSKQFEFSLNKLALSEQLIQGCQQLIGCIAETDNKEISISFPAPEICSTGKQKWPIHYKLMRATQLKEKANNVFEGVWNVKACSITGKTNIHSPKLNGFTNQESVVHPCMAATLLTPGDEGHWKKEKYHAIIQPDHMLAPSQYWNKMLELLHSGEMPKGDVVKESLKEFINALSGRVVARGDAKIAMYSPLWIYNIKRLLKPAELIEVWLSISREKCIISPILQIVEVAPMVGICIQHNAKPAQCFTGAITENASCKRYPNIATYISKWEEVLLAEAAVKSMTDSELLFIHDVKIQWPQLIKEIDSSGQVVYKLPNEETAQIVLDKCFCEDSLPFFDFNDGGLLCIRYSSGTDDKVIKFVLHMVIGKVLDKHNKEKKIVSRTLELKFVGKGSNFISSRMYTVLNDSCDVQLIPLSLPYRRTYRCLANLQSFEDSEPLASHIALGEASMRNLYNRYRPSPLKPALAFQRWDTRHKEQLNDSQVKAIQTALIKGQNFTIIQGPPGTGKSVTGAHIAYALVERLEIEEANKESYYVNTDDKKLTPCVMYCGPSHQSVNVVLDLLLNAKSPVAMDLQSKIVRVYSKTVEKNDFPGPKCDPEVYQKERSDAKSRKEYNGYALHYMIRRVNPVICELDQQLEKLAKKGKIPSKSLQDEHRKAVHGAEIEVLKNAKLILCTCNEASSHRILNSVQPDYVIIDEAAMATEPECMIPILRAKHVVLIGDHKQLKPVIEYRRAEEMGLGVSLFQRYVEKAKIKPLLLNVQYRMHPMICEFPSEQFYDGELGSHYTLEHRPCPGELHSFWPCSKCPLLFCNLVGRESESHTGHHKAVRVGLESKYNPTEAQYIADLVQLMVGKFRVPAEELAVLTPYSAHKEEVRRCLEQKQLSHITVKSVTESQGSQYGIVLFSTVRTNEHPPSRDQRVDIGWIRANLGFITDCHQINVGITRSKFGLIIIGDRNLLILDDTWRALISHYETKGCMRTACPYLTDLRNIRI